MTTGQALLVLAAGFAAGTINAVIGSGTLVTFPVLLTIGLPPVTANVTNTVGLVPGSAAAVWGYRAELRGHGRRMLRFAAASATGSVIGATLLLTLPSSAFRVIVVVLIAGALVLVALQPRISAAVLARRHPGRPDGGPLLRAGITATGVYGGYFGAAQGVLLFALLGSALPDDLQHVNALRNLLAGTANGVAGVLFCVVADVRPLTALVIALGAGAGGVVGARIGRRLSPAVLRGLVVCVGLVAIARVVTG
jgi:uncharacterized membrane protein YfcA